MSGADRAAPLHGPDLPGGYVPWLPGPGLEGLPLDTEGALQARRETIGASHVIVLEPFTPAADTRTAR